MGLWHKKSKEIAPQENISDDLEIVAPAEEKLSQKELAQADQSELASSTQNLEATQAVKQKPSQLSAADQDSDQVQAKNEQLVKVEKILESDLGV